MREEYAIIDTRLIDTSESELVKLLHISFVDANRCADPPAKLGDSQYTNYVSFANPPFVVTTKKLTYCGGPKTAAKSQKPPLKVHLTFSDGCYCGG